MKIEVAYAKPEIQIIVAVELAADATVADAVNQSGLLQRFPEIDLANNKVGIFSKPCKLEQTLRAGDRVEIYRPLIADPKELRRVRATQQAQL